MARRLLTVVSVVSMTGCGWTDVDIAADVDVIFPNTQWPCPDTVQVAVLGVGDDGEPEELVSQARPLSVHPEDEANEALQNCTGFTELVVDSLPGRDRYTLSITNLDNGDVAFCGDWYHPNDYAPGSENEYLPITCHAIHDFAP
jgi:hypothetical protein